MKVLKKYDKDGYAYFNLPTEPRDSSKLKSKTSKSQIEKREKKSLNRQRMLLALPPSARERASDPRHKKSTKFKIASLHFHAMIYITHAKAMLKAILH